MGEMMILIILKRKIDLGYEQDRVRVGLLYLMPVKMVGTDVGW